ncbi:Nicotinate-nucleotide pyrophosphorylase [carboxylating] [Thalassocella blandensis]|nr:Nicotinate-nucleotide pyrophosphorylase [carboxylating] [Thalassocella blandensis]
MNIQIDQIQQDIERAVRIALEEDIGSGDITAQLIPQDKTDTAEIITREDCVICGTAWVDETFKQMGNVTLEWHVKDGDTISANTKLVTIKGNTRNILTGERTALNFLQLLSGTATKASEYRKLLGDSRISILDTRKTIPGLRTAQKYAVAIGGCDNHRIGLFDAFLIKENHIAACGGVSQAIQQARQVKPDVPVEIEVEDIPQLKEALAAGADIIMLDNFSSTMLNTTSNIDKTHCKLEVSGNITQNAIPLLKNSNIDYISIGALTKHANAIDLSLRIRG